MKKIIFRSHAIHRMIERNISEEEVLEVCKKGEIIEEYPDDTPYPSKLLYKKIAGRHVHVVAAASNRELIIITTYEANSKKWHDDYKTRRKP